MPHTPPTARFGDPTVVYELKSQLRASSVLLTCSNAGLLSVVPYPCDTEGVAIPVKDLPAYNQTHDFLDAIHCFCGVLHGAPRAVKIFTSRSPESEHFGCVCIGCVDWKRSSTSDGCSYFVNLERCFGASSLTADKMPLQPYPLRAPIIAPIPLHPQPTPRTPTPGTSSALLPSAPITPPPGPPLLLSPLGLTPSFLCDADRLYTPPPPGMASLTVGDRSVWPDAIKAEQTILSLIDPTSPGTSYTKLVSSLGNCFLCGRVMALHLVLNHYCLPLGEEHQRSSSARKGDKIYGMNLPFGIGVPTVLPVAAAAEPSGSGTTPMGELLMPAPPIKTEDNLDDIDQPCIPNKLRRRVIIPADRDVQLAWLLEHFDELEALQPGLALAIRNGTPRHTPGPLLLDGKNRLYFGLPRSRPPSKRKLPLLCGSEDGEGNPASSGEEEEDEADSDSPLRKKGKGVKRARTQGSGSGLGSGATAEGMGNSHTAVESGAVKEEDAEEGSAALLREEPFTTKDGKQVMRIDLTDD